MLEHEKNMRQNSENWKFACSYNSFNYYSITKMDIAGFDS